MSISRRLNQRKKTLLGGTNFVNLSLNGSIYFVDYSGNTFPYAKAFYKCKISEKILMKVAVAIKNELMNFPSSLKSNLL